ncbi:redoxin domain-containing protein [Microbulbifer hainanensis]|uniref:redoxin domain-containing protein n=1 Tax=Microbulbifer hainanensis TaxID=2735675 RepID=UPI001868DC8E|nr:redoxin domain-containing protein [Microbulbifer hainanensis]
MKTLQLKTLLLAAAFWLLPLTATSATAKAPDFTAALIDGGTFSLREFRDKKPVLLKFWATWCHACRKQMPAYRALHARYGAQVQFLSVNVAVNDPVEEVRATAREYGLQMPVAYDQSGELWRGFGVMGTPMYLLIDSSGNVTFRGYREDEKLQAALEQAIAIPTQGAGRPPVFTPPKHLADIDGHPLSLDTGSGQTLVAYQFAPWCESYLQETDPGRVQQCRDFREGLERLGQNRAIRLVGFASRYSTDRDSVLRYRSEHQIQHPLVFDREGYFAERFGVRDFPYLVVLRNNRIVLRSARLDAELINQLTR